jgi:hypothetical protein
VDLVAEAVPRAPAHLKEMAGRPFAQKVNAERKAAMDAFIAFRRAREAR